MPSCSLQLPHRTRRLWPTARRRSRKSVRPIHRVGGLVAAAAAAAAAATAAAAAAAVGRGVRRARIFLRRLGGYLGPHLFRGQRTVPAAVAVAAAGWTGIGAARAHGSRLGRNCRRASHARVDAAAVREVVHLAHVTRRGSPVTALITATPAFRPVFTTKLPWAMQPCNPVICTRVIVFLVVQGQTARAQRFNG